MPTIANIAANGSIVAMHNLYLSKGKLAERGLYWTREFGKWYVNELLKLNQGFTEPIKPTDQVDERFRQFVRGRPPLKPIVQIRPLRHVAGIVWEFKTPHVRVMGVFCSKDVFLAHCGGDADLIKSNYLYDAMADETASVCQAYANGQLAFINTGKIDDVIST